MKKIFVVSKTHLDLGYTDFAENIKSGYINKLIPNAIDLANQVNTKDKKNFVWTTGSWILKEALKLSTPEQKEKLIQAIKNGNIVSHGIPFTTHSELLDYDTFDYGLSIVDMIDEIRGKKTIAAKLTDVPGHTRGIVKPLAKHGIKLLHIGVNGATPLPKLPECFLWKDGEYEIIVIYSGFYGGVYDCKITGDILKLDHTMDNKGVRSPQDVLDNLKKLQDEYKDYEVVAGTLDDFAEPLWEKRDQLPVFEGEIGDTWIHGAAADPYKMGALKTFISLKNQWLKDGSMVKNSEEYTDFTDNVLCLAEHTWGNDSKKFLGDFEHYLKKDFVKAKKLDRVRVKHILRDYPQNFIIFQNRCKKKYHKCSYKAMEKSWNEKHLFITQAIDSLSEKHQKVAISQIGMLRPSQPSFTNNTEIYDGSVVKQGPWQIKINDFGGIENLKYNEDELIKDNNKPILEYRSFSSNDYKFFFDNFIRDYDTTYKWCTSAFGKPLLKYVDGKYPTGRFEYKKYDSKFEKDSKRNPVITVYLKCDNEVCVNAGAPKIVEVQYKLLKDTVKVTANWFNKDANRLPEATYLHFYPNCNTVKIKKMGEYIDPSIIVSMGNKNVHSVEELLFDVNENSYTITNKTNPIIALNEGKILEFDDQLSDISKTGVSYILHNNVWGTNFPLWYNRNASFVYEIGKSKTNN